MKYSEFIEKILETKHEFTISNISTLNFSIEDMELQVNFETKYFLVERCCSEDNRNQTVAGWNTFDLEYVNVLLSKEHVIFTNETDLIPDNLSTDDFFNYTVNHEVLISYEEYLDLHNVYKRLEEFYGL